MTSNNSKKIKSVLALFTALLMAGCSQNTPKAQETSEVTTVSITAESIETTKQLEKQTQESHESSAVKTETTQEIITSGAHVADDMLLINFLDGIKNGDNQAVSAAMRAKYDFFDDIKLENYTYTLASDQLNEYTNCYDVTLNISSSKSDLFPLGESK